MVMWALFNILEWAIPWKGIHINQDSEGLLKSSKIDVILLNFCKAFYMVPHDIVISR